MPSAGWLTIMQAAKALKRSRSMVFYYVRTGRLKHRHVFNERGRRTEVQLPEKITKLNYGALTHGEVKSAKCAECQ